MYSVNDRTVLSSGLCPRLVVYKISDVSEERDPPFYTPETEEIIFSETSVKVYQFSPCHIPGVMSHMLIAVCGPFENFMKFSRPTVFMPW